MKSRRWSSLSLSFAMFFVSAALASPATASHPATPSWETSIDEDDTPSCLTITEPDSSQYLVSVDNRCSDDFSVESVTCDPATCMPGSVSVTPGSSRNFSSRTIGLPNQQVDENKPIDVKIDWKVGTGMQGAIELTATFKGYTGGTHNYRDAGSTTGGFSDIGGQSDDAGTSETSNADSGCGACSTTEGTGSLPVSALLLLIVMAATREPR